MSDYLASAEESMGEMDLFGWADSLSRKSDPETSHAAEVAVEGKLSGLRASFVEGIRRCGGSATAKEAAVAMSRNPELVESIRKRAKECVDRGFVTCGESRKCKVSGNACLVYSIKDTKATRCDLEASNG